MSQKQDDIIDRKRKIVDECRERFLDSIVDLIKTICPPNVLKELDEADENNVNKETEIYDKIQLIINYSICEDDINAPDNLTNEIFDRIFSMDTKSR